MIGRYRVTRKLGEGGMGIVYAAVDEELGRSVAIKMIHEAATDPNARERLRREARSAASLNHPNICQIYEVGESDGEPYVVMELLEGESLSDRIGRGPIPLGEAAQIGLGLLTALGAVHERGLLHRDLKPSNVFLTPHGPKLLDFGLARLSAEHRLAESGELRGGRSLTMTGAIVGTPRYMAPEQLMGEELDPRLDLFAAGAILFEMLTGKPAFGGATPIEVFHAVMSEQPPILGGSQAIAAFNRICQRAMAKKRDDRYPSAEAMAQDLRAALLVPDAGASVKAHAMTRLIVLPFRILRSDPETDFLGGSLAEAITVSLSGLESLLVRSSLVAARYAESNVDLTALAADAGVDAVLTGTLLRIGDQIRVTTQMVEAPGGGILWSHTSQVGVSDIFALEDALTRRIVESLSLPLTEREERMLRRDVPASPSAYEFYLRGSQQVHNPSGWRVARDLLQRSVEEDARYAPAWVRLARTCWLIGKYTPDAPEEHLDRAEASLRRALELNPDLPMAHHLQADIDVGRGRAIDAMRRLLGQARVRQADPELFAGLVVACRFCGLLDASIAAHEQARRLDPRARTSVAQTHFMKGDLEEALLHAVNDPYIGGMILLRLGREEEALERVRKKEREGIEGSMGDWIVSLRAYLEGKRDEALDAFGRLVTSFRDPEGLFYVAVWLSRLGESNRALEILDRSVSQGFFSFPVLARDPWLDPLRSRPEFAEILRRVEASHREAQSVFVEEEGDRVLGMTGGA